jgi:hypothetical protein
MFEREMDFVLFEARTEFFALRAYRPIFIRTKMMAVIWDVAPCTPEDSLLTTMSVSIYRTSQCNIPENAFSYQLPLEPAI